MILHCRHDKIVDGKIWKYRVIFLNESPMNTRAELAVLNENPKQCE
jgi:hypothetical protein